MTAASGKGQPVTSSSAWKFTGAENDRFCSAILTELARLGLLPAAWHPRATGGTRKDKTEVTYRTVEAAGTRGED